MSKFSNKEAVATYLSWSYDDVEDARYHYGFTKAPVYTSGNEYVMALSNGKKPTKHDNEYITNGQGKFVEAQGSQAEYCKQRDKTVWVFKSE